jgi:hypothetical protein
MPGEKRCRVAVPRADRDATMSHMPDPLPPIVQRIAGAPCALCGGADWSYFPSIAFEHAIGSSSYRFELLVCRACRHTFFFNGAERPLEDDYAHVHLRPTPGTYR